MSNVKNGVLQRGMETIIKRCMQHYDVLHVDGVEEFIFPVS